jgi:predicted XRE-type DNA-binding protein
VKPLKNMKIRNAMYDAGLKQKNLAEIMGISQMEVSFMLKRELAAKEQNEIVERIKDWKEGKAS